MYFVTAFRCEGQASDLEGANQVREPELKQFFGLVKHHEVFIDSFLDLL